MPHPSWNESYASGQLSSEPDVLVDNEFDPYFGGRRDERLNIGRQTRFEAALIFSAFIDLISSCT
jgi:hypothetical protein